MGNAQAQEAGSTGGPVFRSGLIGLMAAWALFATGEVLYGDLDGATDFAAIADASGRFAAGALLQLLAAVLLAGGVVALILSLRERAPRLALFGGWLGLVSAVGVAAFSQFHLVLLAMTDPALDRSALNSFLTGPLQTGGLWGIPIIFVLVAVPVGFFLLALGTARAGLTSRLPAGLIVVHTVVHLGIPDDRVEVASHYLLAVALAWIAISVLRQSAPPAAREPSGAQPHARESATTTQ